MEGNFYFTRREIVKKHLFIGFLNFLETKQGGGEVWGGEGLQPTEKRKGFSFGDKGVSLKRGGVNYVFLNKTKKITQKETFLINEIKIKIWNLRGGGKNGKFFFLLFFILNPKEVWSSPQP